MLIFLMIVLLLVAIAMTTVVLVQPSKGEGLGSIGGGGQRFFAKNKGLEKMFERLTAWLGGIFILLAIIIGAIERFA